MGADIKALRSSIRSVDNMLHLTSAMGLVASSKIRRANDAMLKGREYAEAVKVMTERLTACPECKNSPFMRKRHGGSTRLVIIAGDRGLCGGYNSNVFRLAAEVLAEAKNNGEAEIIPIGKRAFDRYHGEGRTEVVRCEGYTAAQGRELSEKLCRDFAAGEYDRLGIISSTYVSMMSQEAGIQWVLPLERNESARESGMLFEPSENEVLKAAVSEYVFGVLMAAVRESFACEVAARRMAMDSAGKNAQQMLDDLHLTYNRARQSAITQEITEIVAGSGG